MSESIGMSRAFDPFLHEALRHAEPWMEAVRRLDQAIVLDGKTEELVHLGIAAQGLTGGIPFHVRPDAPPFPSIGEKDD
jgi:hypothetical protein